MSSRNEFALCSEGFLLEIALDVAVLVDPVHGSGKLSEDAKTALEDLRKKLDRTGALDPYKQPDGAIRCASFWESVPVVAPALADRRAG